MVFLPFWHYTRNCLPYAWKILKKDYPHIKLGTGACYSPDFYSYLTAFQVISILNTRTLKKYLLKYWKRERKKAWDWTQKTILHFITIIVALNQASRLIIYQFSGKRNKISFIYIHFLWFKFNFFQIRYQLTPQRVFCPFAMLCSSEPLPENRTSRQWSKV